MTSLKGGPHINPPVAREPRVKRMAPWLSRPPDLGNPRLKWIPQKFALALPHGRYGGGSKRMYLKWNPGKRHQGLEPAVVLLFNFDPYNPILIWVWVKTKQRYRGFWTPLVWSISKGNLVGHSNGYTISAVLHATRLVPKASALTWFGWARSDRLQDSKSRHQWPSH